MTSRPHWIPLLLIGILAGCEEPLEPEPVPDPQFVIPVDDPDADGDEYIPPEFNQSPTITRYYVETGFTSDGVFARASMTYFANRASQDVNLELFYAGSRLMQRTAHDSRSFFLPATRQLSTFTTLPVSGDCGHTSLASAAHRAHHEFLLKTGWLAWGQVSVSSYDDAAQAVCPPESNGGGDGWGSELGECTICQQWFWVKNGVIVDEWWECFTDDCHNWMS